MKKWLAFIVTMLMLVSMSACGKKDNDLAITFWMTPVMKEESSMQGFIDAFERENPGIRVELAYQTWEGIANKLQIALSTGDTPDVYLDGAARTAMLPSLGVLVPVDDIMASFDDWYPSVLSFGKLNGTHYLMPASQMGASFLSVNVTLAKELGVYDLLPEDRKSWNIQDFYAFCKAATEAGKAGDIKGTMLYAGSSTSDDILYSLMMSNGGTIIDFETNTCTANSPACVEVIEILGNIVKEGYCLDGATIQTGSDTGTPFYNQQYVAILNSNAPAILQEFEKMKAEGYIDAVPEIRTYGVPTGEGCETVSACWGANGIAIFNNQDEAKITAAKKFVTFLMEQKAFTETVWQEQPNYYPSRNNGAEFISDSPMVKEEVIFRQELTNECADYDFGILESYWSEVRSCFYPELQSVFSGEKTAQQAMDDFAANVNRILADQK